MDHVLDATRRTNDDLWAILKSLHVLTDIGTTDASMALNAHEITNGDDNFLDLLCQLTGWGEDKSLAGLEVGVDLLQT